MLLLSGLWYTSKIALDILDKMPALVGAAVHKTPDGMPVLVFDPGHAPSIINGVKQEPKGSCLVPQNEDGHDVMTTVNRGGSQTPDYVVVRVEFKPADLPDLKRLVEFDHLPEARKKGAVDEGLHKTGDKLA